MSRENKTKFRSERLVRRKMAESDESKVKQERELSAGPGEEDAATSGSALEEPPESKKRRLALARDTHETGVRTMDEKENASRELFEGFSDMTSTLFSAKNVRKIAELWIENTEKAADEALKFQAKATEWSKNTMFAPIFETQNSIARRCVEISAKTARRLWQLE
jgi:hypothetical protein